MSCFYFCFFLLIFVFKVLGYLLRVGGLRGGRMLAVPRGEGPVGVFGEDAPVVDRHHLVHHVAHGLERHGRIDDRGEGRGERTHQVGVRQHEVPQRGVALRPVLDAGGLDDVADAHVRGAGHLAALAVHAVFQGVVVEVRLLEPQTLAVGSRLLRPRIVRVCGRHGAVDRADRALDALLEVVFADAVLLYVHDCLSFNILSATLRAERSETPAPHPSCTGWNPARPAPAQ